MSHLYNCSDDVIKPLLCKQYLKLQNFDTPDKFDNNYCNILNTIDCIK